MNIDWQRVVLNIRRSGVSAAEVARRIGRNESVIQRIARGDSKRVFFDDAVRLLDIHSDACPEKHRVDALLISSPQIVDKRVAVDSRHSAIHSESA